ncbi:MAG: rhodanese-like domain-containing protein [Thermomicrobiales bacterium]
MDSGNRGLSMHDVLIPFAMVAMVLMLSGLVSVVLHGVSATPLIAAYGRAVDRETVPEERESTATGLFGGEYDEVPRITVEELAALASPDPPIVLDVRTRSASGRGEAGIPGSVRVPPDEVAEWAERQPRETPIVAYCT